MIGCLTNPGGCIYDAYVAAATFVPWVWVFWSFLLGAVFGAAFGWLGVISTVVAFMGGFLSQVRGKDGKPTAAVPPVPPVTKPPKKRARPL